MSDVNKRKLSVVLAAGRIAAARLVNRGGGVLENIGWTDEARAASLAVRKQKALSDRPSTGAPPQGKFGGRDGNIKGPINGGRTESGSGSIKGFRYDPRNDLPKGNPNTPYEGKRIVLYGQKFVVKNGVLERVTDDGPGGYATGGPIGVNLGGGSGMASSLPMKQDTIVKKLDKAGVFVPGYSKWKPKDDGRRY